MGEVATKSEAARAEREREREREREAGNVQHVTRLTARCAGLIQIFV